MAKQSYIPDDGLIAAVELALSLGMPLLVTGEPGTGKTQLAYYLAEKLTKEAKGQTVDVLRFNTKTTSAAKDLFYRYDAVRHFRDAQRHAEGKTEKTTLDYISFEPLGKAILESGLNQFVVLVDEIDKAPRDFPNDVLYEFESMAFRIDEATPEEIQNHKWDGLTPQISSQGVIEFNRKAGKTPALILTSNSEKNLPDAFLRRCVYYHIPFPGPDRLMDIVRSKFTFNDDFTERMMQDAVSIFNEFRNKGMRKKPATAELLAWIQILIQGKAATDLRKAADEKVFSEKLRKTFMLLAKNKEDLELLGS